jgi:hypothetical protein
VIAGATALSRRGISEACTFVEFFNIVIIISTATLPSGTASEGVYDREVAIIRIMEISICVGVYGAWRG